VTWTVHVHPDALDEMEDAAAWYEAHRAGLGIEFVAEIEHLLARVADNPEGFPTWNSDDPSRRAIPHRFPYAVFFDVEPARVVVMAIAHSKRRPGYWVGRTSSPRRLP
jgi:toxin ParE1/3/4